MDEENGEGTDAQNKSGEPVISGTPGVDTSAQTDEIPENASGSDRSHSTGPHEEGIKSSPEVKGVSDDTSISQTQEDAKCADHVGLSGNVSENQGDSTTCVSLSSHIYQHLLIKTKHRLLPSH